MKKNIRIERPDGEIVHAIHGASPKNRDRNMPLVILVHGFPKNQSKTSNFLGLLADMVEDQGCDTLQFDFVHCAGDLPQTENFTLASAQSDMRAVFAWAEKQGYENLAFIAEGFGAPVTFMSLPEQTRFCVLCWPVFDLPYVRTGQFKADNHTAHIETYGYLKHKGIGVGHDFLEELDSVDLIPYLEDARAPILVLHGEKDRVIPIAHLDIAREYLGVPRLEITTFDDGEYGLDQANHRRTCLHHIATFMKRYALKRKRSEINIRTTA